MTATVKTNKGVHRINMDRWGNSTHRMPAFNARHRPTIRDQRQMERMKAENMVLYPYIPPQPVLPPRNISGTFLFLSTSMHSLLLFIYFSPCVYSRVNIHQQILFHLFQNLRNKYCVIYFKICVA